MALLLTACARVAARSSAPRQSIAAAGKLTARLTVMPKGSRHRRQEPLCVIVTPPTGRSLPDCHERFCSLFEPETPTAYLKAVPRLNVRGRGRAIDRNYPAAHHR